MSTSRAAQETRDSHTLPPGRPVRCDGCGLFTRRDEAMKVPGETGDYGYVCYWVVLCKRDNCKGYA